MAAAAPTQEMPPPGGYEPIVYKRIPARTYLKGWHWFAGVIALKVVGTYFWYQHECKRRYINVENRSAHHAILPLLLAEKDRGYLRQLLANREEEEKLMADHPDWQVGKYYDEPVYKTVAADQYVMPCPREYFAHSPYRVYEDSLLFHNWH